MSALDEFVNKIGGYEQLSDEEKSQYHKELEMMSGKSITVDGIKQFIDGMVTAIETALVDAKEGSEMSRGLKARLKNALVLQKFLRSPQDAKEAIEKTYKARL